MSNSAGIPAYTPCKTSCGQPEPCWGCDDGDYEAGGNGAVPQQATAPQRGMLAAFSKLRR